MSRGRAEEGYLVWPLFGPCRMLGSLYSVLDALPLRTTLLVLVLFVLLVLLRLILNCGHRAR